jgi:hypothetical protein
MDTFALPFLAIHQHNTKEPCLLHVDEQRRLTDIATPSGAIVVQYEKFASRQPSICTQEVVLFPEHS